MATKVLVIDDSITMRALFSSALERSKDLVVVGTADGADEAREMIAELRPDVLTLDVEMPGKNGLEFLAEIMETRPMPVIMLSTLTQKGADVSLRAMEIGAVDCFPKPARATPDEFEKIAGALCKMVLTAAKTNMLAKKAPPKPAPVAQGYVWDGSVVAVAGGMGGIDAAIEMLAGYPENCPPTIVLQTMQDGLAAPFATKLAASVRPRVELAADGVKLQQGVIYVAADPARHIVIDRWPGGSIRLVDRDPISGCRPSADLLFSVVAKVAGASGKAVILSGAGADGVAGIGALAASGGTALLQARESALISEVIAAAALKAPSAREMAPSAIAQALTLNPGVQAAA